MKSSQSGARQPLSRRALLTLVWVGAFVILGLVGLRAHSAELVSVPVVAESVANSTTVSAGPGDTIVEKGVHATQGSWQGWHLDLLAICMLSMLATLMLIVLFTRRPWLQWRFGSILDRVVALPRATARPRPLLLLHSISRT